MRRSREAPFSLDYLVKLILMTEARNRFKTNEFKLWITNKKT